jgi:hypothetical protein
MNNAHDNLIPEKGAVYVPCSGVNLTSEIIQ